MPLEKGEVVILDNQRMAHGRTPFEDDPGNKRKLYLLLSGVHHPRNPLRKVPEAFKELKAKAMVKCAATT